MNMSSRPFLVVLCSAVLAAGLTGSARQGAPLAPLVLPPGFQADAFAEKVENAREMALGPQGTVFVGSQYAGKVHAVVDSDGDHKADRVVVIASGLDQPNGIAMRNGALYVATASRLLRFDDIEKHLDAPPAPVTVRDDLPNPKAGHTWKFIAFGPDDMLYMSVGAPCNVCVSPPMVSSIVRMKPDGSGMEVFAEGVRNVVTLTSLPPLLRAQARTEITINDTGVQAENLTSSQDGTVYFGSTAKGTIYRAAPGTSQAEAWIQASTAGLSNVLGVLADDKTNTLWVCQNNTGGRGGAPVVGQTALRAFDLKTRAAKGTYPLPTNGGVCNDMAVSSNGTVYATESFSNRIHRLRPGATALDVWITDPQLAAVDGVALLADGAVYVNTFFGGRLFRIPVNADGSAGTMVPIETSMPLNRPDGLRTVGPQTLIQAEGQGRLTELTIKDNRAEVRVLQDGLTAATGVTVVGNTALVLVERAKAVAVPYRPQ